MKIKKRPAKTDTTGHIKPNTQPRTNLKIMRMARQAKTSMGVMIYHFISRDYSMMERVSSIAKGGRMGVWNLRNPLMSR
ncbi:hypothetical protein ACFLVB_05675, partial [Chloroflexota bacterium]